MACIIPKWFSSISNPARARTGLSGWSLRRCSPQLPLGADHHGHTFAHPTSDNALGVKLRLAATASRPRTPPLTARCSLTLGWTDRVLMRPDTGCPDALWSLYRVTPTPSRLPHMREGKDDMVMVTGEQPGLLLGEPALGLEIRALRARPVSTRVVPDARHMTIRTGLDMAAKGCGSTLHDGVGGSTNVGGQGMALLIGWKRVLEDRLERDERHRCLRTRGRRRSSGCFLQYHAHYPRDKRLVQPLIC
jgi:hypothetical protein